MFVLIDLDEFECPPSLRCHLVSRIWKRELPQKMFFCVADVRWNPGCWLIGETFQN